MRHVIVRHVYESQKLVQKLLNCPVTHFVSSPFVHYLCGNFKRAQNHEIVNFQKFSDFDHFKKFDVFYDPHFLQRLSFFKDLVFYLKSFRLPFSVTILQKILLQNQWHLVVGFDFQKQIQPNCYQKGIISLRFYFLLPKWKA